MYMGHRLGHGHRVAWSRVGHGTVVGLTPGCVLSPPTHFYEDLVHSFEKFSESNSVRKCSFSRF